MYQILPFSVSSNDPFIFHGHTIFLLCDAMHSVDYAGSRVNGKVGNGKFGNGKLGNHFFGWVGKVGNGKLGSGNPGSFANSTVILLFICNVDMQLLYIKLSAVIYATLLNFQSPFSQFQQ